MKKLFIILAIISFGFLVFQSCKKENNEAINRKKNGLVKKKIDFNNFMQDKTAKLYYDKSIKKLKKNNNKNLYDSINHFTILTDSIDLIQDDYYQSYTFKILFDNQAPNTINTLLLSKENSEYMAFIFTYTYDTQGSLINIGYSELSDFSIDNLTSKSRNPFCWCCHLSPNSILWVTYGCHKGGGSDSSNNNSDNTSNNGGDSSNSGTDNNNDHFGNGNNTGNTDYGYGHGGTGSNTSTNSPNPNNNQTHDHVTVAPTIEAQDDLYSIFVASNINNIPINYIYDANNKAIIQTLYNYIQSQNNSMESIEFAYLVTTTPIVNDVNDINTDDCIIFRSSSWNNYPFAKNVIQEVLYQDSDLLSSVRQIFDSSMAMNYVLTVRNTRNSNAIAETTMFPNPLPPSSPSRSFVTTYNPTMINHISDLLDATVASHESMHAILSYASFTNQINTPNNPTYNQLVNSFLEYVLINPFAPFDTSGTTQHNVIAQYINLIAQNSYTYATNHNMQNVTLDYCKKLAWVGLLDSDYFRQQYYDNQGNITAEGQDIIDTITAEQEGTFIGANGQTYTQLGQTP